MKSLFTSLIFLSFVQVQYRQSAQFYERQSALTRFICIAFVLLFISLPTLASTQTTVLHQWLVQPKACIVQKLGESCQLNLVINIPALEKGQYCYFLQDEKLTCFAHNKPLKKLTISITEDSLLELRKTVSEESAEPIALYSQVLEIKTRESTKKVRRVRDPWSLF